MRFRRPKLKFVLDESVPDSVGRVLKAAHHQVIFLNRAQHVPRGAKDDLVCAFALLNNQILVAIDKDMRNIAKSHGVSNGRFSRLNLVQIECEEPIAASRVKDAITLIEHEWYVNGASEGRRLFVQILKSVIRTNR